MISESKRTALSRSVTRKKIQEAKSRVLHFRRDSLKNDIICLIWAYFEKKEVGDDIFPVLAQGFMNETMEVRKLILILFLMAIKRRRDIGSTISVLQSAFQNEWERSSIQIPWDYWNEIDKVLKRPSSEYNQLLASVITRYFVSQKNPEGIFNLLEKHYNHINRVHGIWFSVPSNREIFAAVHKALCNRCLGPGPED